MDWSQILKESRRRLSLTQAELASRSQVSLPYIQMIEANRTNPSVKVLGQILEVLGLELQISSVKKPWSALEQLGLPLHTHTEPIPHRDFKTLRQSLSELSLEQTWIGREAGALWGFLAAIRDFFPAKWKTLSMENSELGVLLAKLEKQTSTDGSRLKLRRIAAGRLAEYL